MPQKRRNREGSGIAMPRILRRTAHYVATSSARGVRITATVSGYPRSRVVFRHTWDQLASMSDSSFDGSCVLELGIATFRS